MKQKFLVPILPAFLFAILIAFVPIKNNSHLSISHVSIAQTDSSIRGLNYTGFLALTPLNSLQTNFQPIMWTLWKGEHWDSLENLISSNNLNSGYPPAAGFVSVDTQILAIGTKLDRYGSLWGRFVAPEDAPFSERSLPASSKKSIYYQFEVTRAIHAVLAGKAIPWFGQEGMGMQYMFSSSINTLIDSHYLKITETVPAKPTVTAMRSAKKAKLKTAATPENEKFIINGNGKNIAVSLNDFASHPLHTVEGKMTVNTFNTLLANAGLQKAEGTAKHYLNKKGQPVYCFLYREPTTQKSHWVVVSFSEISADHFSVEFEGMVEDGK